MRFSKRTIGLACVAIGLGTGQGRAQSLPVGKVLETLFQDDIRLASAAHEAHFLLPTTGDTGQARELAVFNQQLLVQLSTIPIGSPSGGFSYTFDPTAGTFERTTESFGPLFSDRALTNGKGRLTFGTNVLYSKFSTFEGEDLESGDVRFFLRHSPVTGGAFFEGDLVQADLRLDVSTTQTVFFANYGISDRWDVAVAAPLAHVQMDAAVDATIIRLSTATIPAIHQFPDGSSTNTFTRASSATGLGDILVRTKYRFLSREGGGLAAAASLRLPSGDAENLLGTGTVTGTFTLIGSSEYGRLSPHFNVEYAASGEGDLVDIPNEFGYRFGTDFVASPRLTFSGDLIGRSLIDAGRLELTDTTVTYREPTERVSSTTITEYTPKSGSLNLVTLAIGGKINVAGNLLINANLLVPLTSSGVNAKVTPVFGFDYLF